MRISTKVKLALRNLLVKAGSIETDKGSLLFDGEEIAVGTEVFVESEGEIVAAEDGEYVVEDTTYVVAEGKVTEIREKEEEEVEVSASRQKFEALKAAFEASYEERIAKIAEAIRSFGFEAWVVEAADTYAVAEVWDETAGDYKHIRFDVAWDEEGNATVSNPEEVKSEFVPVEETPAEEKPAEETFEEVEPADDAEKPVEEETKSTEERLADAEAALGEIREGIETLTNAVASIIGRLEEVEGKLSKLEEPAAEPAEEGEETEVKASRLSYLRKK